jgi:DNA-binding CsgD family transcriptional regulator
MTGPKPAGRRWIAAEENQLKKMVAAGMTAAKIARKLNRTAKAIYVRLEHINRKRPANTAAPKPSAGAENGAEGEEVQNGGKQS